MNELTLLKPKLARLKLSGMLETLEIRLKESMSGKSTYTDFLLSLLRDEIERRDSKQLKRRMSKSMLDPVKTLEAFDFMFNPKIHEPTIKELATCAFLVKHENIFILGQSGVGKSHLAQAIGHEAVRRGHEVFFKRTNILLKWIGSGVGDGTYDKRMQYAIKIPILILDDFGLKPLTEKEQEDLYEVICERYEKKSTIITSNRAFVEWPEVFNNPLMSSAAMDRLVHRANKIIIVGESYRMNSFKNRKAEKENKTAEAR